MSSADRGVMAGLGIRSVLPYALPLSKWHRRQPARQSARVHKTMTRKPADLSFVQRSAVCITPGSARTGYENISAFSRTCFRVSPRSDPCPLGGIW